MSLPAPEMKASALVAADPSSPSRWRRHLLQAPIAGLVLAALGVMSQAASAQDNTGLIRIIVPFPAGAITDVTSRIVGASMAKTLGRSVVVENRSGAAGAIGTRAALLPSPAGVTTLLTTYIGFYGLPFTQKSAGYDPEADFVPVAMMADGPAMVFVHSSVPAKNMAEFVAWARNQPQGVESATSGPGGGSHMWTLLLAKRAGINLLPVPYKGGGEQVTGLISGDSKLLISTASEALIAQAKAGKVRLIGVASERPTPLAPGVPTIAETIPGFVIEGWYGLHAPATTSPREVAAISAAVRKALDDPTLRKRLASMYLEPRYANAADFHAAGQKTREFWKKLVADLAIQPQ